MLAKLNRNLMNIYRAALGIFCCFLASACDTAEPVLCTLEARPGIEIEVRDAVTGEAAAAGAVGIATENAFADTLMAFSPLPDGVPLVLTGLYERAGTYEILITKAGYNAWRVSGVKIERDECHVKTVRLEARLLRE